MIDFLKYRYICFAFGLVVLGAAVGGFWYNYQKYGSGFNYSVDFTGGTELRVKFNQPIAAEKLHHILAQDGQFKGIGINELDHNQVLIRVQEFEGDAQGIGGRITTLLQQNLPDYQVELLRVDSVGSSVGGSLRSDSVKAILIALLLMLIYVTIRFKLLFAIGTVIALFHDVLFILAFFLLTHREISMDVIGAILMVLGYSMNDTIVIFSRIRENLQKMTGAPMAEVINTSINQTLRRTTLTSSATALVVCSLMVFGGEMLRGLSIALLLGIIIGTYSSIFIASPIMLLFYKNKKA